MSATATACPECGFDGFAEVDHLADQIEFLRAALSALVPTDTHHLPVCDCACCRARAALRETAP